MEMKTFVIDIPDDIYARGNFYANEQGISFSELCELAVLEMMKLSETQLSALKSQIDEKNHNV